MLRKSFIAAAFAATLACMLSGPAAAVGALADISVIDRNTGATLPVYQHQGRYWVAGQPGSRYAVRVHNRSGGRLLSVLSIDGVNVISGETAATSQSGYVFSPWERYDLTGWRKSQSQVASFYFTALPDSYAARTGRPDDVGVIGVALFRERAPVLPSVVPQPAPRRDQGRFESEMWERAEAPAAPAASAPAEAGNAAKSASDATVGTTRGTAAPRPESKLGTGHGQRESAPVTWTSFQRMSDAPDEVVVIHYDSRANLLAMGVISEPRPPLRPRPFPGQPEIGFVPDPPR